MIYFLVGRGQRWHLGYSVFDALCGIGPASDVSGKRPPDERLCKSCLRQEAARKASISQMLSEEAQR